MRHVFRIGPLMMALSYSVGVTAQCPDGITADTLFHSDFETGNGGFSESGGGDWDYGVIPVVITGGNCGSSFTSPGGAYSGTMGWGTVLDDCYNNLGAFSGTGLTVDLSDPVHTSAQLAFAQWYNVFVNFDYLRIIANGTEIYRNDTAQDSNGWLITSVDLTPFLGQASVGIVFDLWASTVVNRAGWYIDDVLVTACAGAPVGVPGAQGAAFIAWPVPATGQLHVEPSTSMGTVKGWALYDATGRVLAHGGSMVAGRFTIDVSGYGGLAILELRTTQGTHRRQVVLN